MSKSFIGKALTAAACVIFFAFMIANNIFRAFTRIPNGTIIIFVGFFVIWAAIYFPLRSRGYFDWFK